MKLRKRSIKLPREFYTRSSAVSIAQELLGKTLLSAIGGTITGGMIIETEAYEGPHDRACHAYQNRRTPRTEVMFGMGGHAYVYLCYGMHCLFNIVTGPQETAHAVLIRALLPEEGIEEMSKRRNKMTNLTSGPGTVCQALGITRRHSGSDLLQGPIWVEDRGFTVQTIEASPRIGIDYAGADALLPWRFTLALEKEKT
jgi:DNA-3-methyladenine glycosylase